MLDESKTTDKQKGEILRLIDHGEVPVPNHQLEAGQSMLTISHGIHGSSREVLKYRGLFKETTWAEIQATKDRVSERLGRASLTFPTLMWDYFEDQDGNEITDVEMADYVAGGGPVIILGKPESVTRLGPAKAKETAKWTVESANTLAHFFQVVDHIAGSQWYHSPISMTIAARQEIISSAFPSVESALGILLLFRQLYSSDPKDDLFNRACGVYLRYVDHEGKAEWIKAEKGSFNRLLTSSADMPGADAPCSTKEVLDVFLYGAGLVHSRGKDRSDQQRLHEILKRSPAEKLVMAFHCGMKYLLGHALSAYPVIKQDFVHWVEVLGLRGPELIDIGKLLRGSRPDQQV